VSIAARLLAALVAVAAVVLVAVVVFDLRPPGPEPASMAPVPTTTLDTQPSSSEDASSALPTHAPTPSGGEATDPPPVDASGWTIRAIAPIALTEVAAAALGGRIWVAGGLDGGGRATDRVIVYDPASDAWSAGPSLPVATHHSALVAVGGSLLLVGGYRGDSFSEPTSVVLRLDPGASTWVEDAPLPEDRAAGGAASDGTRVAYGGGVGRGFVADTVFVRDEGGAWSTAGRLSEPREHLAAAALPGGPFWFLGGRRGGLDGNLGTVDLLDTGGVRALGAVPTARGGVAAFATPELGACLVGGEGPGGTNAEVECLAADGAPTLLPDLGEPRHGLGAAVVDGVAYVLLGGPEPGLFVSDAVEALDLGRR
jgi:hypothetical protein